MSMQFLARAAIAGLMMVLPYTVNAASSDDDWYAGVGFGKSENKSDAWRLGGAGFSGSQDTEDSAWKVFGGYRLWDQYVAVEMAYIDLGESTVSGTTGGFPSSGKEKIKLITIGAAGYIPIVNTLGVVVHVGFSHNDWRTDTVISGVGTLTSGQDFQFYWGGGLQYDFSKQFGARAEFQRFQVNNADINLSGLSIYYRF